MPLLVIIGPGEFWADEGRAPSSDKELALSLIAPDNILRAYDRLSAQAIYLSPAAQTWLGQRAGGLAANYLQMQNTAKSRIIPLAGKQVGIIFFAPADQSNPQNIAAASQDALAAGRKIRREVDLLIGVSPWGSKAERSFAKENEGLYHIILGGGPGYGFGAALIGEGGGVLWARPEDQGRSVNLIHILKWPEQAAHRWEPYANFEADIRLLGPAVPADPVIMQLFPEGE